MFLSSPRLVQQNVEGKKFKEIAASISQHMPGVPFYALVNFVEPGIAPSDVARLVQQAAQDQLCQAVCRLPFQHRWMESLHAAGLCSQSASLPVISSVSTVSESCPQSSFGRPLLSNFTLQQAGDVGAANPAHRITLQRLLTSTHEASERA